MNDKLRLILKPYLILSTAVATIYSFLNWLLVIKLEVVRLEQGIVNIFIPLIVVWIPTLIWMLPRIKLFAFSKQGAGNAIARIIILNGFTIGITVALLQLYLVTASGKLTRLKLISEIKTEPRTKYYTAKYYYAGKRLAHVKRFFELTGKNKSDFRISFYVAVPLFNHLFPDTNIITNLRNHMHPNGLVIINGKLSTIQVLKALPADSIRAMRYLNPTMVMPMYGDKGKFGALAVATRSYNMKMPKPPKLSPSGWLAVKYTKTISNRLSETEKDNAYKSFARESWSAFDKTNWNKFVYLDRVPYGDEKDKYLQAVSSIDDVAIGEPIILYPVFEPFDRRNENKLLWAVVTFGFGTGIFLIVINEKDLKSVRKPRIKKAKIEEFELNEYTEYVAQRDFQVKTVIIEGTTIQDMESFYNEIDRLFTKNLNRQTGHTLDALNDLLRGGFGVYDYHEPIRFIWKNFDKSRVDLGADVIDAIVQIIESHDHIDFYKL